MLKKAASDFLLGVHSLLGFLPHAKDGFPPNACGNDRVWERWFFANCWLACYWSGAALL